VADIKTRVAEIDGHQRKVVESEVRPTRAAHGTAGIPLRAGRTLGFRVRRAWNAPAGHYAERWYLVDPATREVLFEGPERLASVWGLQSWTEYTDDVEPRLRLTPGTYLVVFALGGVMGGQLEVEAAEVAEGSP
jgi:hypothetical protein